MDPSDQFDVGLVWVFNCSSSPPPSPSLFPLALSLSPLPSFFLFVMSLLRVTLSSLAVLAFTQSSFTQACPQASKASTLDLSSSPVYQRSDAANKIRTTVGSSFVVELSSNPTTGYSWQVSEGYQLADNSPGLDVSGCEYVRNAATSNAQPRMVGVGGVERWVFVAKAEGEQLVPLQYARPWEKEDNYKADPTLVLTVEVAPASSDDPSQAEQAAIAAEERAIQDLVEAELDLLAAENQNN